MEQQPDLFPRQTSDLHARALGDELLIYAPRQGVIHILNRTARVIWEACDGVNTPAAMVCLLHDRFDMTPEQASVRNVMHTLHELRRLALIDWG